MLQDYRLLSDAQHESIEKQTLFAIVHALQQYSREAKSIFDTTEADSETEVIVLAEDVVQYAIEVAEVYPIDRRFAGFTDYKRVRWLPTPFGLFPQALLVDAKASKEGYRANLQRSQMPMDAELTIQGTPPRLHVVPAGLPAHLNIPTRGGELPAATTSIFVHMHYETPNPPNPGTFRDLKSIIAFCLPHGRFKPIYNPNGAVPGFWRKGKESPGLGEALRIRVSFTALSDAKAWRMQRLSYESGAGGYTHAIWNDTDPVTGVPVQMPFDFIGR
jgi:hypothetical protein